MALFKKSMGVVYLICLTTNICAFYISSKILVEVVQSSFKREVLDSPIPVFLAVISKNATCKLIDPLFLEIHKELDGNGKVVIMKLEKNSDFAKELGVVTTPILIVFNKGKKLGTIEINMSPSEIKSIAKHILDLHLFTSLGYYRMIMRLLGKIV
ncbi:MAG TPA: thioredoxin family protein [Candidatus Saccharimonadales bacterium]|nr:thioredoxin family protein [Candidatus Saccharimonadales bacterium]